MAILITKQPKDLAPAYSDLILEFTDSNQNVSHYDLEITCSGVTRNFKVYHGIDRIAKFNLSYILQDFMSSTFEYIPLVHYTVIIKSYANNLVSSTKSILSNYIYNGTSQKWEDFNIDLYKDYKRLLNNADTFYINPGDKLTVQVLDGYGTAVTTITSKYWVTTYPDQGTIDYRKHGDILRASDYYDSKNPLTWHSSEIAKNIAFSGIISLSNNKVTTALITNSINVPEVTERNVKLIDISQSTMKISNDVRYYEVNIGSIRIKVHVLQPLPRFTPKRFRYINSSGATNYVNFNLAESERIKIKQDTYDDWGNVVVYNTEVTPTYSVISDYMPEAQSLVLEDLWFSPKVELQIDGRWEPVILQNKTVSVLHKKEKGLINYKVSYRFASKYNVQRQ